MRILLDEDTPIQALEVLRHVLPGHRVDHVQRIGWKGKKDPALIRDAARRGYDVLVTHNAAQLVEPGEYRELKRTTLHHVTFRQERGLGGLARAIAALVAAMPDVVADLERADGQRLVTVRGIARRGRYEIRDPRRDPPTYWTR